MASLNKMASVNITSVITMRSNKMALNTMTVNKMALIKMAALCRVLNPCLSDVVGCVRAFCHCNVVT